MAASSKLYAGLIFEYREAGKLLGVMTGVENDDGIYLQHVMVWPGARAGALLRIVAKAEQLAWERNPGFIVLDIEHLHPQRSQLAALADRRGYRKFNETAETTWFVKFKETR